MCYIRVCIPPAGRSGKGGNYTTLPGMPQDKPLPDGKGRPYIENPGNFTKTDCAEANPVINAKS
jgi:hypothetical protein